MVFSVPLLGFLLVSTVQAQAVASNASMTSQ